MFHSLLSMNPIILVVLATLVVFSVASWAIILFKLILIRRWKALTKEFLTFFEGLANPLARTEGADQFRLCPLFPLYIEGIKDVEKQQPIENVDRTLRKVSTVAIEKLGKDVSFLATTASVTPFIGLFGTVWGIMNAFQGIGDAGSTSLAVVAPGISEALVTTAVGLVAAIPALIAYNFIQSRLRSLVNDIDHFAGDFLNLVQARTR